MVHVVLLRGRPFILAGAGIWRVMVMREPDGLGGPGTSDARAGDVPRRSGPTLQGWRAWGDDVVVVLRSSWRTIAVIMLVTMALPMLPLAGLIADGVAVGAAISLNSQDMVSVLAAAALLTPALLALAVWCALLVGRGWTSAAWAAASAAMGRRVSVRDALRWSRRRSRLLGGSYLVGVAVLVGVAFLAGYLAPRVPAVPDLLVLAGPAGLLAPVLIFVPAAAWRRRAPGTGEPPTAEGGAADGGSRVYLAPVSFVLAVVVSCDVAAALALSWLLTSASPSATGAGLEGINGPAAAIIASLIALPGSVMLAAASYVSCTRLPEPPPSR
jgi:hypothetical protein